MEYNEIIIAVGAIIIIALLILVFGCENKQ